MMRDGKSQTKALAKFCHVDGIEPWERHPDESEKAFRAFRAYRDLGVDRSIKKAAEQVSDAPGYWAKCSKWSVEWRWVERCQLYGDHLDAVRRQEAVLEERKRARNRARKLTRMADNMIDAARKSLYLWNEYLDNAVAAHKSDPINCPMPNISIADVNRLADAGVKISRLMEGKPTEIHGNQTEMTIEERRRGIQQIIANPKMRAAMRQVAEAMEEKKKITG